MRRTLLQLTTIICALSWPLPAADEPKQRAQVSKTERLDFLSGGILTFSNSIGELTVQGWDQPELEITTIKSTKREFDPRAREKATEGLDKLRIMTERRGDTVTVTTEFPRHRALPPPSPVGSATNFNLEYNVKVPRNARLIVDHDVGEVHVDDIEGDIRVTALQGEITLHLAEKAQYSIDAKADFGNVISDFPGRAKRRLWLLGHQFSGNSSDASQNLYLRIGSGDIIMLRARKPPTPAPRGQ